jgi:hypothetical protein
MNARNALFALLQGDLGGTLIGNVADDGREKTAAALRRPCAPRSPGIRQIHAIPPPEQGVAAQVPSRIALGTAVCK